MIKRSLIVRLMTAFLILYATPCYAEDVRITTYYPSPYGSYKHLSVEDGATNTTSYGSLQIVRQENSHLGSHLAFIRDSTITPKIMGLGYKQSSDIFGFGPGVDSATAFDPAYLSIDSSGSVGIGTNAPNTSAALEVAGSKPVLIPRFTPAGGLPDPSGGANGMIYYNTFSKKFRIFQNGAWTDMASLAGGSLHFITPVLFDASTAFASGSCGSGLGCGTVNFTLPSSVPTTAKSLILNTSYQRIYSSGETTKYLVEADAGGCGVFLPILDVNFTASSGFNDAFKESNVPYCGNNSTLSIRFKRVASSTNYVYATVYIVAYYD